MTTELELASLADRVEAAVWPQPNRVLNREVARAVGWCYQSPSEAGRKNPAWFHPDDCRNGKPVIDSLHGTDVWREPLDYLGSLDAAMMLAKALPEGEIWIIWNRALTACSKAEGNLLTDMARYFTAYALRARSIQGKE